MQKNITPKKVKVILYRTCFLLFAGCLSFNASFAQKQPASGAKPASDEQRKQAYAASQANASAAFSDAVKNESPASVKTGNTAASDKKAAAEKPAAAIKRKNTEAAAKADLPSKPKSN